MQAMVRGLASALRLGRLLLLEHFALIQAAPFAIATLPERQGERCAAESLAGPKRPFELLLSWLIAVPQYLTRQRRCSGPVESKCRAAQARWRGRTSSRQVRQAYVQIGWPENAVMMGGAGVVLRRGESAEKTPPEPYPSARDS